MNIISTSNPREAAYLALLGSLREEAFIDDSLRLWREAQKPASRDYNLCQEIAFGSARMALSLDYLAKQLTDKKSLKLKLKEKALLRTAIYQFYFMDRVPLYAITDETVNIAKKYCHSLFINFLNAILRKLSDNKPALPQGNSIENLSIRYSYPDFLVKELIQDYGVQQTQQLLEAGNRAAPTHVRLRPQALLGDSIAAGLKLLTYADFPIAELEDTSQMPVVSSSPHYYIQNITPASLIQKLSHYSTPPQKILDLCASPGGKLIAAHDCFPNAKLYANDISEAKVNRLKENIQKYQLDVSVTCSLGEQLQRSERFDVIILDVPCSNSGVLNKRPEARWRISEQELEALEKLQLRLIEHAKTLLSPEGAIWFMTCSILKRENEKLIEKACRQYNLKISQFCETVQPNENGWDGGFGCLLKLT